MDLGTWIVAGIVGLALLELATWIILVAKYPENLELTQNVGSRSLENGKTTRTDR